MSPFTWAPEGWPKWSPTSACQSGDQVVDTPYENPSSPRAQGARFRPSRAGFGGFRARPGIQNPEFRIASEPLSTCSDRYRWVPWGPPRGPPLAQIASGWPGYLKAVWPDFGGAFLRSGRPRGTRKAFKSVGGFAPHLFEVFPGPPGPARLQKRTPQIPDDCLQVPRTSPGAGSSTGSIPRLPSSWLRGCALQTRPG